MPIARKQKAATRTTGLPCRLDDAATPDLLVTALGPVRTPLTQATYDPRTDRAQRLSGGIVRDYYRRRLGVPYFRPLDKRAFPHPPTGWLTWMYYGRDVTPAEILVNARWIAEHLRDYGVNVVLIDDGWQKDGRNWEGTRETFPRGMKWLAGKIRELGLEPGLWICPHGQDNAAFVKATGGFIDCATFGGPYSVDPTDPKGAAYLRRLFARLTKEWGYSYLKFDGIVGERYGILHAYRRELNRLANPPASGDQAFRRLLEIIGRTTGPRVFIGGCGILGFPGAGLCHGMRTGADTDAEWTGFLRAVAATMNAYFMHQVAWYSDPDCCLLRPPLSTDMARAWASLYGLTGQMLMFDDRMPDLGPERVRILKKISPAADIRPFDLFPSRRLKTTFDLKVNRLGRAYDVIGLFNYGESEQRVTRVDFKAIGLDPARRYHVYDFWNEDYLGVCDAGLFLEVPPAACRVVTLFPEDTVPVLLSTSRHVLQGWPDLERFAVNRRAAVLRGASRVIAGEPYTLTFGLPNDGVRTFALSRFRVTGKPLVGVTQGRGVARATWTPATTGLVEWEARFRRQKVVVPTGIGSYPYMLGARDLDPWTVEVYWISFGSPSGFYVRHNGRLIGYTFSTRFRVGGLKYGSRHTFEVGVADLDGRKGARTGRMDVVVGAALPRTLALSDLAWTSATSGYLHAKADKSVSAASLSVGGRRYAKGIGTHPSSTIVYDLQGLFLRLGGAFGIEDQNGIPPGRPHAQSGQARFSIRADGRELLPWTRRIHGQRAVPFDLDVRGARRLELCVEQPEGAAVNLAPHADWLDLKLSLRG